MALWSFLLFSTYYVWLRQLLISGYIILHIYKYKESYWLYIFISITLSLFNWYQTLLIFWLRTSNMFGSIYMERNRSVKDTFFFFLNYKATDFSNTVFYCHKHISSIASYYSKYIYIYIYMYIYSIVYKIFWKNKVL